VLWNVFSFDQWGVQLGKILAQAILNDLNGKTDVNSHDSSTNAIIARLRERSQKSLG